MVSAAPLRALLLEDIHPDAAALLRAAGYDVEQLTRALEGDELIARLDGIGLLGIRSKTTVTAEILKNAPDLLVIGAFCIGTNQVDLGAASANGIAVFNAPFSNTRSVVELAVSELIALTRRLTVKDALMHRGIWDKSATGSHEIRGRTLGIVGYGNIGSQLSVLAEALGMSVVFYDKADKLAMGNARRLASLDELLDLADVVTLHVDGRPGNSGFFGPREFARMRKGSLFLNLSRGFVVDHGALRAEIEGGRIAGAAVDVFPEEPSARGEEFVSQLRGLENVILTPHVGGSTEEAQQDIGHFVAGKLRDYIEAGVTTLSVNLPSVALAAPSESEHGHRLLYLHHNTPGVLATVSGLLAEHSINIVGQLLGTWGEYGYVVTDVAGPLSEAACDQLRSLPVTVRLRLV